jgi:16S rRNA (guanine966-N2)-methyltransferase
VADYAGAPFELILIDPPYAFATNECEELLTALASGEATDDSSTIILERSTRSQAPQPQESWGITDQRHYGETAVFFIEPE